MDYGETADVQEVHAAIQREKREPRVGLEPLSIWLIAVYGLAIFFGGAYLGRYVIVVDDDIDPTNTFDVLWALASRSDPVESIEILRRCWSGPASGRRWTGRRPRPTSAMCC